MESDLLVGSLANQLVRVARTATGDRLRITTDRDGVFVTTDGLTMNDFEAGDCGRLGARRTLTTRFCPRGANTE